MKELAIANPFDYFLSFSPLLGWTLSEVGSESALCLSESEGLEVLAAMKAARDSETRDESIRLQIEQDAGE